MTDTLTLASQFINSTSGHIFLTGKAGTGKTTFLRNLARSTHKQFLIVAPTGIAALNAGGVTIHSQFLLPFGSYIPDRDPSVIPQGVQGYFNSYVLTRRHPLNSQRKQVLRNIDLLVIDEVSMLRADILDAIDFRLRSAKGNYAQPFGGVQLLLIGDLYQLPPIVRDQEWETLSRYYPSMHFFEALSLRQAGYTYIELDKIFRQQDEDFIQILNNLRNNCCTPADIDVLNQHYQENISPEDEIITLCTHNAQADRINDQALAALPGTSYKYKAELEGDFPENLYPIQDTLELKKGTQVMFIKNDTLTNRFFNGKLAKVVRLDADSVTVLMAGEKKEYVLEKMTWKNIRYVLEENSKDLKEETVGTFTHYPIKLAWAITVHKSQGLTFEKAIIDVGKAFAPGQVYVALSRLRSLDGLVLRTKINTGVISSDGTVVRFSREKAMQEPLPDKLRAGQVLYLLDMLRKSFDFEAVIRQIEYTGQQTEGTMSFEDPAMQVALTHLRKKLESERENSQRFQGQIARLLQEQNHDLLRDRIDKGSKYYLSFLNDCLFDLLLHLQEVRTFSRTQTYTTLLEEIDQLLTRSITDVQKAGLLTGAILDGSEIPSFSEAEITRKATRADHLLRIALWMKENPKKASGKSGKVKLKKEPPAKGATYLETYALIKSGMTLEKVAEKRNLVMSTIETHVSKGIAAGELAIEGLMAAEEVAEISTAFMAVESPVSEISEVFTSFGGKYSYGKLRMVQAHLRREEKAAEKD